MTTSSLGAPAAASARRSLDTRTCSALPGFAGSASPHRRVDQRRDGDHPAGRQRQQRQQLPLTRAGQ